MNNLVFKCSISNIKNYNSCFITGTAAEITPVSRINNLKFDTKNLILKKIIYKFNELIKN